MTFDEMTYLPTHKLLELRFCDIPELKEPPRGELLVNAQCELRRNLLQAGLQYLDPEIYLGDEWFTPSGVCAISVPFYLAHPRLTQLEREMHRFAEGSVSSSCIKLLRHEAGHCFDHLYQCSKTKSWQDLFGDPALPYRPDTYRPRRHSRDFVRHLPDHYAQAHPDEDFAETFAVAITPHSHWRMVYRKWPVALAKLEYVSGLIAHHGHKRPKSLIREQSFAVRRKRMTLARHYELTSRNTYKYS